MAKCRSTVWGMSAAGGLDNRFCGEPATMISLHDRRPYCATHGKFMAAAQTMEPIPLDADDPDVPPGPVNTRIAWSGPTTIVEQPEYSKEHPTHVTQTLHFDAEGVGAQVHVSVTVCGDPDCPMRVSQP